MSDVHMCVQPSAAGRTAHGSKLLQLHAEFDQFPIGHVSDMFIALLVIVTIIGIQLGSVCLK